MIVCVADHGSALPDVVAPDFIQPEDVIGVAVREQDRVETPDVVRESLGAQIGPGVHEQTPVVIGGDEYRSSLPAIFRITGVAGRAIATNHRHAV